MAICKSVPEDRQVDRIKIIPGYSEYMIQSIREFCFLPVQRFVYSPVISKPLY